MCKRRRSPTEATPTDDSIDGEAGDETSLILPHKHLFSLQTAAQARDLSSNLPDCVVGCEVLSAGLVQLTLRAGRTPGLEQHDWPILVGGIGVGDEPHFAATFGGAPRSPIAVRFAVSCSMQGVDDAGFVDETFWLGLGDRPTLRQLAERAVAFLSGPLGDADDARLERWNAAAAQTASKLKVIETFRSMAACSALVAREPARLEAEWLVPSVRPLVAGTAREPPPSAEALLGAVRAQRLSDSVVAFDLFEESFCRTLVEAVDAYEASELPRRRPNTMNTRGLIVNEIGMEPLMGALLSRLIAPLANALFPREPFVSSLDHHHSFVVQYDFAERADRGLDMHHDASEITLNVCLGRGSRDAPAFGGGGLRFCGQFGASDHRRNVCVAQHSIGRAVMHLGRQRHGADDLQWGERINLIVWARSSAFRAAAAYGYVPPDGYPKASEDGIPHRVCLSRANDADYDEVYAAAIGEPISGGRDGTA